jgi:hypothetical protein
LGHNPLHANLGLYFQIHGVVLPRARTESKYNVLYGKSTVS